MQVELKVVGGKQNNQVVPLPPGKFLIGREQDCHLRPNSEMVSRHHCVFTTDEFGVRVRDLGSTNGTFVNGERIEKQIVLKEGDKVVIGTLNFEVVLKKSVPVAAEAAVVGAVTPVEVAPAVSDPLTEAPAADSGNQTVFDMPLVSDDTQSANSGDTTMIPVQPQAPAPRTILRNQCPTRHRRFSIHLGIRNNTNRSRCIRRSILACHPATRRRCLDIHNPAK